MIAVDQQGSAGQAHVKERQLVREAGDLVDDDEIPSTEHPPQISRAGVIEPDAENVDGVMREALYRPARIFDEIALVDDVDVGRFTVGDHQYQPAMGPLRPNQRAGMAQRAADPVDRPPRRPASRARAWRS